MGRIPIVMVAGSLALTGCSDLKQLFTAHSDAAAQAGGQELTAERLATILSSAKAPQANQRAAEFAANLWIDYTLFAQAVARGDSLSDSATIAQVTWPEISETRATRWHDTLMAHRTQLKSETADSAYAGNEVRVLQHILFRVPPNAEPPVRSAAAKKAGAALSRIKGGANFGGLAEQLTEDPAGKRDSGYLPPSPKGAFVTAFDSAGWSLDPGEISEIVETPFGFHIIRRPPASAVRNRMLNWLTERAGRQLDSLYMDSLAVVRGLKVKSGAPAAMRAAVADRDKSRRSSKSLVAYRGGELTVGEFVKWVNVLPAQVSQQITAAPDSELSRFARVIATNMLLLEQADSAGVALTPVEWAGIQQRYRADLDSLSLDMGLIGPDFRDSSVAVGQRYQVAGIKVDEYLDRLLTGRTRPRPVPGGQAGPGTGLGGVLRERGSYRLHPAGIARAVELATEKIKPDSAAGPGGLQPAKGPAPLPSARPAPKADSTAGSAAPAKPQ